MNQSRIYLCLLGCFCLSATAFANNTSSEQLKLNAAGQKILELRLHEAIAFALKDNISIQNAYLSRISDKLSLFVAQDTFRPQYSLSGATSWDMDYDDSSDDHLGTGAASTSAGISLQNPYGGQLALTLSHSASFPESSSDSHASGINVSYIQPLLRGSGYTVGRASLTLAEYSEHNSVLSLKSTLIGAIGTVINTYRTYVQAIKSLKISQLSLKRSEQQVEINKELIQAGRLASVELIQSKTDLANQQLSLRSSQNSLDSARLSLLRILRLDQNVWIEPTEPLTVVKADLNLEELLEIAFNNRSDYMQSLLSLESAELSYQLAQDDQRWDLNLTTTYNLAGSNTGNAYGSVKELGYVDRGDFSVNLDLTIPIADVSRKQTLINARIQRIQTKNNHIDLKESIRLELVDKIRNIDILWEQVSLSKRSLDLTTQQLELEQEKLRTGRSSNFQVVSFQNQLASAENQYVSAQISYLNALTDLDASLGTTLQHWGVSIEPKSGLSTDNMNDFRVE